MRRVLGLAVVLLSACQGGGFGQREPAPSPPDAVTKPLPETASPARPVAGKPVSGVYTSQFRSRAEDGKGKLRDEFGSFVYWLEETAPGSAVVRYEGNASYVSRSPYGGSDSAWVKVSGRALLKQGTWVLNTTQGGQCEVRFQIDGGVLLHLSALCEQPGQFGHYAWPPAQTALKYQRPLKTGELQQARKGR